MNEKDHLDEQKNGRNEAKRSASKRNISKSSESNSKGGKKDPKDKSNADNDLCEAKKKNLSNFDIAALYEVVKCLFMNASKLDKQVTKYTGGLYKRVKYYFINIIESYEK